MNEFLEGPHSDAGSKVFQHHQLGLPVHELVNDAGCDIHKLVVLRRCHACLHKLIVLLGFRLRGQQRSQGCLQTSLAEQIVGWAAVPRRESSGDTDLLPSQMLHQGSQQAASFLQYALSIVA